MESQSSDLLRVRDALVEVQERAQGLRWAEERPWTAETHVWDDQGMVTIDLHDLNAKLSKAVLAAIADLAKELQQGGVVFVTGQGRHSVGVPVLRQVISGSLVRFERERGWRQRDIGRGRILLVVNEEAVPGRYREGTPWWVAAFFVAFMVAMAWALPPAVGLPMLALAAWFAWAIRRSDRARSTVTGEE